MLAGNGQPAVNRMPAYCYNQRDPLPPCLPPFTLYILECNEKTPEKSLTKLSQAEIVSLAVYRLGGAQRAVDTEDVAVEAHRIAPGRFSWKKYPDQINLELIRVFLSDAKKN